MLNIIGGAIAKKATNAKHFAKCNNVKCGSFFVLEPGLKDEELGYLCPECSGRSQRYHIVQCSSCKTVLNFIGASDKEDKFVFTVEKCSHCFGTEEDECMIHPVYATDHFI